MSVYIFRDFVGIFEGMAWLHLGGGGPLPPRLLKS